MTDDSEIRRARDNRAAQELLAAQERIIEQQKRVISDLEQLLGMEKSA